MILGGTDDSEDYKNEGTGSASTIVPTIEEEVATLDNFVLSSADTDIEEEVIEEVVPDEIKPQKEQEQNTTPVNIDLSNFVYNPEDLGVKYKQPDVNLYNAEFFELEAVQNSISTYLTSRDGKSGARQEGESKEEYAERYFTHMRWLESNLYKTGKGITWLGRADDAAKGNFAYLYTAYKEMPGAFSPGGGDAFSAVQDYIYASVLDPVNVVTLGTAMALKAVGGRMAGQVLLRTALRNAVPRIALAGSVETLLGAVQEAAVQTVEQRAEGTKDGEFIDMRDEKDWKLITAMGLVNGTIGTGLNILGLRQGARNTDYAGALRSELDQIRVDIDPSSATHGRSAQPGAASTEDGLGRGDTVYDNVRAQSLMDSNILPTDAGTGALRTTITDDIIDSAERIMELVPDLRQVDDEQLSDAVMDVVATIMTPERRGELTPYIMGETLRVGKKHPLYNKSIETKDGMQEVLFEDALDLAFETIQVQLKKADISQEEFAQMMRLSADIGGTTVGRYGINGRRMNKFRNLSPREQAILDPAKNEDLQSMNWYHKLWDTAKSWDRARRALLTSMPITTLRNIGGASSYVTLESGTRILAGSTLAIGRGLRAAAEGRGSVRGTVDGVNDIVRDSFSLFGKLLTYGNNRALSDLILKDHTKLARSLLRTTNEAGENELNKIVRGVNALNIAQDQFIRSGVFIDSIERQLKTFDLDPKKILAQGKVIPRPVVKKAVEEALKATFSAPAKSAIARNTIGIIEELPLIATTEFPFMRFMMNAVNFQYKYSFFNILSAGSKSMKYKKLLQSTSETQNVAAIRSQKEAAEEFGRTVIGTAMLMAAIKYRSENQDISALSIRGDNGESVDVSAMYPLPAYLAMGDLFFKAGTGASSSIIWRDISQGILGLQKAPFSDAGRFFSDFSGILDADEVSLERLGERFGKFTFGLFGQVATPVKFVKQVVTAFDDEESIIRDPTQVNGDGFWDSAYKRGVNELQRNTPILSQQLPPRYSVTTGKPERSDFAPSSQMTGIISKGKPTEVESELEKFGFKTYFITRDSGNKTLDALVRKKMSVPLNEFMKSLMDGDEYKYEWTRTKKKSEIDKVIARAKLLAEILAQEDINGINFDRKNSLQSKAKWQKLPTDKRKLVDEAYLRHKKLDPSEIPSGQSATTTIYQDKRWDVGLTLLPNI